MIDEKKAQVDLDGTKNRREAIRGNRLNGMKVKVKERAVGLKETDYPVSEYLQVSEVNGEKRYQCKWCGEIICNFQSKWKEEVPSSQFPTSKAGPLRVGNGEFFLHEFYCPSCATLLDTEVVIKGDKTLHDEIAH